MFKVLNEIVDDTIVTAYGIDWLVEDRDWTHITVDEDGEVMVHTGTPYRYATQWACFFATSYGVGFVDYEGDWKESLVEIN